MGFWKKLVQKFVPLAGGDAAGETAEPLDWEALLIEADLGVELAGRFSQVIEQEKLQKKPKEAEARIRQELEKILAPASYRLIMEKPEVILLVGVNGSGKTTTAAKLAQKALRDGKKVMLAACDTFRAAAVDQLQVWGERLQVPVISAPPGRDPASVAYQAWEEAQRGGIDLLIVDTAGRMPNKNNLMMEIEKVKRVLGKKSSESPHHVWLVADGTTGNNVLLQAREFHGAVKLTGLIMTKLDSSAKGGMIPAVRAELGVPTLYIGRGESTEDLELFDSACFLDEFFG